ncbi:MAG: TraR/DksA C4-type zinc finger protein [Actinobacteria bacterium]|nr:TraR/DksA C4-type zinc finger protein [Actinomycetota bacterium]
MSKQERSSIDERTLERVVDFHGHLCPGLAMGVHAAQIARREIGPHSPDEEVVAVVETDMCAVDAIQFLTGCTFGKGNLVHRDYGKNAYTFFRRSDGRAVRVVGRPDAWQRDPEHQALFAKIREGTASDVERARFRELHQSQSRALLSLDPDELFSVAEVDGPPPPMARIHASVPCAQCGEGVMETRVRRLGGRELCQPCFDAAMADT